MLSSLLSLALGHDLFSFSTLALRLFDVACATTTLNFSLSMQLSRHHLQT